MALLLAVCLVWWVQPPQPGLPPRRPLPPDITTDRVQHATLEVRLAERQPRQGLIRATVESTGREVFLYDTPLVTNVDVQDAQVEEAHTRFNVVVTFTEMGAGALTRGTVTHPGAFLAITLDGTVVSTPSIRGALGNRLVIAQARTRAEAEGIAAGLRRR